MQKSMTNKQIVTKHSISATNFPFKSWGSKMALVWHWVGMKLVEEI